MIHDTREKLAKSFKGEGVELGVAAGYYSSSIIRNPAVTRLWSIDRWTDHHDLQEYKKAAELLAKWGQGRCVPLRMTFSEAVPFFADDSLQFIYIDGYAHTGQDNGQTLADWWSKLQSGGIFAGHDYHPQFPLTIDAVDAFAQKHGLQVNFTNETRYPSWWVEKP
jgi:predicted O-methyltransferase YrrM